MLFHGKPKKSGSNEGYYYRHFNVDWLFGVLNYKEGEFFSFRCQYLYCESMILLMTNFCRLSRAKAIPSGALQK